MPKAPVNGIDLYYESHGSDSAPTIVFAHGRGGNHMSWWQQVAAFSGEYRCITFDQELWFFVLMGRVTLAGILPISS